MSTNESADKLHMFSRRHSVSSLLYHPTYIMGFKTLFDFKKCIQCDISAENVDTAPEPENTNDQLQPYNSCEFAEDENKNDAHKNYEVSDVQKVFSEMTSAAIIAKEKNRKKDCYVCNVHSINDDLSVRIMNSNRFKRELQTKEHSKDIKLSNRDESSFSYIKHLPNYKFCCQACNITVCGNAALMHHLHSEHSKTTVNNNVKKTIPAASCSNLTQKAENDTKPVNNIDSDKTKTSALKRFCKICNKHVNASALPTNLEKQIKLLSLTEMPEQYRPNENNNSILEIPKDVEEELKLNLSRIYSEENAVVKHTHNSNERCNTLKNSTQIKRTFAELCNIKWNKSFFDVENKISFGDLEKKFQIIQSVHLSISCEDRDRQCLICNATIQNNVHYFYAHVRSLEHQTTLTNLNTDHEKSTVVKMFTRLQISEEGIQKSSDDSLKCMICNHSFKNNDNAIREHLLQKGHKQNKIAWKQEMLKFKQEVLEELRNCWYSIQWFSCVKCKIQFELKACFIEHVVKMHMYEISCSSDLLIDCCIPCATAWLGYKDTYFEHCRFKTHLRLLNSNDFDCTDLSTYTKEFLSRSDENIIELLSSSIFHPKDKKNLVMINALESAVRSKYPQFKIYPFGSRHAGLSQPHSDYDYYIDCENGYNDQRPKERTVKYLQDVGEALRENRQYWEMKMLVKPMVPIMKVLYRPTGMACDLPFSNGLSVENTKLLRAYTMMSSPCRRLILYLKRWVSLCSLNGRDGISSYALALIVIFYLQKISILPNFAALLKQTGKKKYVCGWETCDEFNVHIDHQHQNRSTQELLVGFFEYYANFDYRKNIICPLLGEPIPRITFVDDALLPKEMSAYERYVRTSRDPQYFRLDSCMCVQDPITLHMNKTKAVSTLMLKAFRKCCLESAEYLNSLKDAKVISKA